MSHTELRISRRSLMVGSILAASVCTDAFAAFPDRPLRIIVPFAPGGGTDTLARIVGRKCGEVLGQPVVVENRPGASSILGTGAVASSSPDGYTMLLGSNTLALNPSLRSNLPYDTLHDLAAVAMIARQPLVIVVHPSVAARTLGEFIALAKAQPGRIAYASSGAGSGAHLAVELLALKAGLELLHVPYSGTGPGLTDLLAGRVQMTMSSLAALQAPIEAGRLRVLGIGDAERLPTLPDVPTIAEAGVPGYEATSWNGLLAQGQTPPELIDRLNAAVRTTLEDLGVQEEIRRAGAIPQYSTAAAFRAYLLNEVSKWREVIVAAHVQPN
jgi:tripartite-type tricarboxylate transporter receptor subunit TctC